MFPLTSTINIDKGEIINVPHRVCHICHTPALFYCRRGYTSAQLLSISGKIRHAPTFHQVRFRKRPSMPICSSADDDDDATSVTATRNQWPKTLGRGVFALAHSMGACVHTLCCAPERTIPPSTTQYRFSLEDLFIFTTFNDGQTRVQNTCPYDIGYVK